MDSLFTFLHSSSLQLNCITGFQSMRQYCISVVEILPIFSVTVMMLSDMVDSVIVLNDEHCKGN